MSSDNKQLERVICSKHGIMYGYCSECIATGDHGDVQPYPESAHPTPVAAATVNVAGNQCDGCALRLPVDENGFHYRSEVEGWGRIHMACTKHKYVAPVAEGQPLTLDSVGESTRMPFEPAPSAPHSAEGEAEQFVERFIRFTRQLPFSEAAALLKEIRDYSSAKDAQIAALTTANIAFGDSARLNREALSKAESRAERAEAENKNILDEVSKAVNHEHYPNCKCQKLLRNVCDQARLRALLTPATEKGREG